MVRRKNNKAENKVKAAEAKTAATRYTPPPEIALELKRDFRQRAIAADKRPKPYTYEEVLRMYANDLATVEGSGWITQYLGAPGWQDAESKEMLLEWQEDSRKNLEALSTLPESRWHEVYDAEDVEAAR